MRVYFLLFCTFFSAPVFAQALLSSEYNPRTWVTERIPQCEEPDAEWKETCDDFSQGVSFNEQNHLEHSRYSYYKACMSNLGLLEREQQNLKDSDYYLEKACLAGHKNSCASFLLNQAYQGNFKVILPRIEDFCSKQPQDKLYEEFYEKLCTLVPFMKDPARHPIAKSLVRSAFADEFKKKNVNEYAPSDNDAY